MSELIEKYGEYIVEPGTLLFRQAADTNFHSSMFFAFCSMGAGSADLSSDTIQVWQTTRAFKSLLMLKGRQSKGESMFLFSAIVDIFNKYFPAAKKEEYDDVMLKQGDTSDRRQLIDELTRQGIASWVCSVEDKSEMELFLFGGMDQHKDSISFVESYDLFPLSFRKEYDNSFNYEAIKHLPEIRKGPRPPDPSTEWMMRL